MGKFSAALRDELEERDWPYIPFAVAVTKEMGGPLPGYGGIVEAKHYVGILYGAWSYCFTERMDETQLQHGVVPQFWRDIQGGSPRARELNLHVIAELLDDRDLCAALEKNLHLLPKDDHYTSLVAVLQNAADLRGPRRQ